MTLVQCGLEKKQFDLDIIVIFILRQWTT